MRKLQPKTVGAEGRLPMNRIILADDQAIFRAGTARVLALEEDMRIIAQCEDPSRLSAAIASFRNSVVIVSSGMRVDLPTLAMQIDSAGSFGVLMVEKGEQIAETMAAQFAGVVGRGITSVELIDCVRRVSKGQHYRKHGGLAAVPPADSRRRPCARPPDSQGAADQSSRSSCRAARTRRSPRSSGPRSR